MMAKRQKKNNEHEIPYTQYNPSQGQAEWFKELDFVEQIEVMAEVSETYMSVGTSPTVVAEIMTQDGMFVEVNDVKEVE